MTDAKDLVLQAPNAVLRAETAEKAVALCEALRECGASVKMLIKAKSRLVNQKKQC